MFNIRIKKSPSNKHTGDQDDYSLVRNLAALQSNNTETSVNDKLSAVPRSQATLEAEGGESVFGDVNRDGNMELMHFVGKKHPQGGVPADIPEGSFIFSDTKSLTIKDREVIEKIFGLPFRKQGYTPAEISKKFDINQYVQILKSETEDELSKRTAAEMLRANKDKLGILAFIQESMKGFPDGIPTIAEEVMAKMGVDPQQLIQESQPQPQEGGAPGEGMSPEDQQMMMAMMQEQGAPMEGDMPMQQYGGLTRFDRGGEMRLVHGLRNAGYQVIYPQDGTVKVRLNPNSQEFTTLSLNKDLSQLQSLVDKPVGQNSKFETGKIYTFKSRPGTYYKVDESGNMLVKNENTGWKYTPMEDPRGERRKVLEAGLDSGLTSEFKKSTPGLGLPGFKSKSDFESFKKSGAVENAVALEYKKAIDSKNPSIMIDLAEKLEKSNVDAEYSLGFIPWSNQDKIQDFPDMLREEASKLINKTQNQKFLQNDANNVAGKLTTVISDLQKKYNSEQDITAKINIGKELQKAKTYLKKVQSPEYKTFINGVKNSNPIITNDGLARTGFSEDFPVSKYQIEKNTLPGDIMSGVSWDDVLTYANKKHAEIKKIPYVKTNLIGNDPNYSQAVTHRNVSEIDFNPYLGNSSKKTDRNITVLNGVVYTLTPDPVSGHYIYNEKDENGGDITVTDPNLYDKLNKVFTTQYGKTIKAMPPVAIESNDWANEVVQNEGVESEVEPVVVPSAKEQLRNAPQVQRKPIVTPKQSMPVQQSTQESKYDGGLSDDDFNNLFKQFGGEIDEYEEGGIVDSFGHTIKLPNHILKQYNPGGPVVSKGKKTLANGTEVETFEQKFDDGTVLQIIKDNTGKVLSQRAVTPGSDPNNPIGLNIPAGRSLYRGLTEEADINTLSPEEKDIIKTRWAGNADAYVKHLNTQAALFGDSDFTKKMMAQYQTIVKDPNNAFYTGDNAKTKKYFADKYSKDLQGLKDADVMSELLAQEERNARLAAYGHDAKGSGQVVAGFDKSPLAQNFKTDKNYWHTNAKTLQFIKDHPELADLDFTKGHRGQTGYLAYMKTLQENPDYQQYDATHLGMDDEGVLGLPSTVSGTEGYSTNTTLEERLGFKGKPKKIVETKVEEKPQGKWYCVDGKVVQGTIDAATNTEVKPTGTKVEGPFGTQADAEAACKVKTLDTIAPQNEYNGWFMPDIVNYATAMGQRIPFTPPAMRQMQVAPSGYDLTNPIQKISADQSNAKQISDQLFNTMDANTAAATMMGNRSLENLNAGITQTELGNLNTVNQNYQTIGNRAMQVDQFNTQARSKYDAEMATAIEERADQLNDKDAMLAKLYGAGWWNAARDTGNRVRFPQAKHINRITGKYDGFGGGRDLLDDDTQSGSNNANADVSAQALAEYNRAYKQAIDAKIPEDEARKLAQDAQKQVYNNHNYYRTPKNRNQQDGYYEGMSGLSMQKNGGSFYSATPEYDFFFGE